MSKEKHKQEQTHEKKQEQTQEKKQDQEPRGKQGNKQVHEQEKKQAKVHIVGLANEEEDGLLETKLKGRKKTSIWDSLQKKTSIWDSLAHKSSKVIWVRVRLD